MDETPVSLPSAPLVTLAPDIVLQPPLSRRGHGPGLLIILPTVYEECKGKNETLDPDPLQKWAEEGYAVVRIITSGDRHELSSSFKRGLDALVALEECDEKENFGVIGRDSFIILLL
jgi:carboxymethylenebutenolidase